MLTGYQCEVVCFALDGEILCPTCATEATNAVAVAKAERGLTSSYELSPWIRYSAEEYASENAWEYASQEYDEGSTEFQELYDELADELLCGSCNQNVL